MDALGAVFLVLLLLVFIISNIMFSKKLKDTNGNHFKLKIIFFFSCIIAIVFIAFFIFESSILIDVLKLEINDTYAERIGKLSIILPLNIIANYFLAKFYLKKKRTNEIELIGKE